MPVKYIKDGESKRVVEVLDSMATAIEKKGLPEGSAAIIADLLNVLSKIASDQAVGGVIICVSRDEKGEYNVSQGTFVGAKVPPLVYYDLSGRAHALANRLGDTGVELDSAAEEVEDKKEEGGLH